METIFFDTHTHYNHPVFDDDIEEIMEKIKNSGVRRDAVTGYDLASSEKAAHMAGEDGFHLAVTGIHPLHVTPDIKEKLGELEELVIRSRPAAIGETGLDFHIKDPEVRPDKELQEEYFRAQLRLAAKYELPAVIHSRNAALRTFEILEEERLPAGGVIHCYSYSAEMAERFVKLGFFLGIGGTVTFRGSGKVRRTVQRIPLEYIVLETDAPYQSPEGKRGERNDSSALLQVAASIAEIKGISVEETARITWENALRLYRCK